MFSYENNHFFTLTTKSTIENTIACLNISKDQINKGINVKLGHQEQRNCRSNIKKATEMQEFEDEFIPDIWYYINRI